jgi:hypothetical protein
MAPQRPNWHELAEQASEELDPVKLMSLADELNRALETKRKNFQAATDSAIDISARLKPSPRRPDFSVGPSPSADSGEEALGTRLPMVNPEPARGIARSVGSLAPDTGRYQPQPAPQPRFFSKGNIFVLNGHPEYKFRLGKRLSREEAIAPRKR